MEKHFTIIDPTTGKYPDLDKISHEEEWASEFIFEWDGFAVFADGTLMILDENEQCVHPPEGRFEILWNTK